MTDVLQLIAHTYREDRIGQKIPVDVITEAWATEQDLTRSEFFAAGQMGLKPEYELEIADVDYDGQAECIWRGKKYSVYRAYNDPENSDAIELYLTEKVGD